VSAGMMWPPMSVYWLSAPVGVTMSMSVFVSNT